MILRWQYVKRRLRRAGLRPSMLLGIAIIGLPLFILLAYRHQWTWTGFVGADPKFLWEWLELLIIPIALGGGALWFNQQARRRELQIADQHRQDNALQRYLDR